MNTFNREEMEYIFIRLTQCLVNISNDPTTKLGNTNIKQVTNLETFGNVVDDQFPSKN